jgi:Sec-independent protein secretion pathway component TatC|uniref:SecY-independent transporter protein n=1 Tax=Entomoneis sp. TaxID=186043 RepID=A0A3G1PWA7_9STRA|nr:SecY-independent transporter protein [Entomoneis sp.]
MGHFFLEITNRLVLMIFVKLNLLITCYYYKEVLYFILINDLILNNNFNFYFVYTNITELFLVYFKLVNFFSLQFFFLYLLYTLFTFVVPALYKKEFILLKKALLFLLTLLISNFFLVIVFIFPATWAFFYSFQELFLKNLIFLEVRINDYFQFFTKTYYFMLIYIFNAVIIFLVTKKLYYSKIYIKKFRKLNYLAFFFLFTLINPVDLFSQIFFLAIFYFCYELLLFFLFLKKVLFVFIKIR